MASFTITTSRKVADQIIAQCNIDAKFDNRTYKLGSVIHEISYSVIEILPKNENIKIKAEDIFWLGYLSNIVVN